MRAIKGNKREADTKSYLDQTAIYGGEAYIFRTPASRDKYQFRIWIPEEKKYYRKSLKTSDKQQAIKKAQDLFIDIRAKIKSGQRFFGVEAKIVVSEFVESKRQAAQRGEITAERVGTISSQLKHFIAFVKPKTIFSQINPTKFLDYSNFRKDNNPAVKLVTIKNEQSTIGALFDFAYKRGYYSSRDGVEFEKISIKEVGRRDSITIVEYRRIYKFMRSWVSNESKPDLKIYKAFIRDFILIKSNSMLRFGELLKLRWRDVGRDVFNGEEIAEIRVSASIAKTRKSRVVYCRGYEYFKRIKKYSSFTEPGDYIFSSQTNRKDTLSEKIFYESWRDIMTGAKIDRSGGRKVTYYSLRHFAISSRIYANVPLSQIAKIAGTSVQYIESHYDHTQIRNQLNTLLANVKYDEAGIVLGDVSDRSEE